MAKTKYYVISEVDKEHPKLPHSSDWPKLIAYSFDRRTFLIKEGRGHGLMGAEVLMDSLDDATWGKTLEEADARWFVDLLHSGEFEHLPEEKIKDKLHSYLEVKVIEY